MGWKLGQLLKEHVIQMPLKLTTLWKGPKVQEESNPSRAWAAREDGQSVQRCCRSNRSLSGGLLAVLTSNFCLGLLRAGWDLRWWMAPNAGPVVTVLKGPRAGCWQLFHAMSGHGSLLFSDFTSRLLLIEEQYICAIFCPCKYRVTCPCYKHESGDKVS